jgi:hypothetical protein
MRKSAAGSLKKYNETGIKVLFSQFLCMLYDLDSITHIILLIAPVPQDVGG